MSLQTLRMNKRKQNAFLSKCFNFTWLGKYRVDIHVSNGKYSVFFKNFNLGFDEKGIPYVESSLGSISCKHSYYITDAIEHFNLACYALISDFKIKSQDDFYEFFDFQRLQGFNEWLPELQQFLK